MNRQEINGGAGPRANGRLRERLKDGLVAVSLANLCFVTAWFNTLYDKDSYFNKLSVGPPQLLALLSNIGWLAGLVWVMLRVRCRARVRLVQVALDLGLAAILLVPINFVRYDILQIWDYQVIQFFKQPVVILCSLVVLAMTIWGHRLVAKGTRAIGAVLSPLAVFTIGKTILLLAGVVRLEQQVTVPKLPAPVPVADGRPRVIWIIFDSADYRLICENRPADVQMPEFDRLRNESLCPVNAVSPARSTICSMPALISGRQISAVKTAGLSDLNVTMADTGEKTTWKKLPSVFGEARAMGFNTALVGWYHPYDRVLEDGLNYCSWYPFPMYEPDRAATFGLSLRAQLGCLFFTPHARHIFLNVCLNTLDDSIALVTNKTYGLVLLHLPPPHTPGVYLPKENRFTFWPMTRVGGYFNNLGLMDLELGRLRKAMEFSGQWDKSWIILSADHSSLQAALYDGNPDPRIPFLIKPPEAGFGTTYAPKINTVITHDLILAILRGELTNQADVITWLDQRGKPLPTIDAGDGSN